MSAGECFFAVNNSTNITYQICEYQATDLSDTFIAGSDVDKMWILLAGFLVFFMQGGFTMLEAGMVKHTNVQNILFKNIMDACIGCISFFLFGYCIAYGGDDSNGFIGTGDVALSSGDYNGFFFQWAFAATAATIVSGSVAERCRLDAYFVYTMALTTWVYPVVVHWMWSGTGWLSPWHNDSPAIYSGAIDFAGSGVVHMVGGWSGLFGAFFLGPRSGRFDENKSKVLERQFKLGHNVPMQAIGTLILWFGWYGFNCGSTLAAAGAMDLASKVAVNTTLAAATGGIVVACLERYTGGIWCVPAICNGVLGGLVSVTAPCAVVKPSSAVIIGCVGGAICWGTSKLLEKLKIDDPLDAFPVHGVCGMWGVISAGIFAYDSDDIEFGGYSTDVSHGEQFAAQLLAVVMIALWCSFNGLVIFGGMAYFKMLRVDLEVEQKGLDWFEHGGSGYSMDVPYNPHNNQMSSSQSKSQKEKEFNNTYEKEPHHNLPSPNEGGNGSTTTSTTSEEAAPATNGVTNGVAGDEVMMAEVVNNPPVNYRKRSSISHPNLPSP